MDKVIVIVGPTAVGKTALSIELAKRFNGEIINGDAMQVYQELNIGTAKIKFEQQQGIKHHLFDIIKVSDDYSVFDYQNNIRECINKVVSNNKTPIIVGGTGLYIKAALYDYNFANEDSNDRKIEELYADYTNEALYELLKQVDFDSSIKIHHNNRRRVMRALKIYHSGTLKSQLEANQKHEPLYDILFLGLTLPREILYRRIDDRVDIMIEQGLVDEVKDLLSNPRFISSNASKAIGYKELIPYFEGQVTLQQAIERIKINTHQYAKKQYTWFNNQFKVTWVDTDLNDFGITTDKANQIVTEFLWPKSFGN